MSKDTFASNVVTAALWADAPEGYEGNGKRIGLATEDRDAMLDIAVRFYDTHADDIEAYGDDQAGIDFWLTTRGHGAGFWEHSSPEAKRLDEACRKWLPDNEGLYEGDDGLLYWIYTESSN